MTLPVEINPLMLRSGSYQINRSLRFDGTAYLSANGVSGNRNVWTFSCWTKRTEVGAAQNIFAQGADNNNCTRIQFLSADTLRYTQQDGGATTDELITTQVFRDTSSWYHIMCSANTLASTEADRIKLYVNGSQITSLATANYPARNVSTDVATTASVVIGARPDFTEDLTGYLADVYMVNGQDLTPSSFGQTDPTTGAWVPKKYTGTYGTAGFYLNFSDNSSTANTTLGKDYSPNEINFTPTNFSLTAGVDYDSMTDTPTNNFATFVPISTNETISDGALVATTSINTETTFEISSIAVDSGKWYVEFTPTALSSILTSNPSRYTFGIIRVDEYPGPRVSTNPNGGIGDYSTGYCYQGDGTKKNNGTSAAYGASYTTNDVIGVAYDADAGTIIFYKNGVSQGTAYTGITSGFYYFATSTSTGATTSTATYHANYGQTSFSYTPPDGYNTLCTRNLPDPTIKKPLEYANTVTYTGNGTNQTVTGLSYTPDLVWIKSRATLNNHAVFDSVRGANNQLITNTTGDAVNQPGSLLTFNTTGFTLGSNTEVNASGRAYVAWTWDETPTAGFDIVARTGTGANANVSHALSAAPAMIIGKARTTAGSDQGWPVWHKGMTTGQYVLLNTTDSFQTGATVFNNNIVANSTHFSVGTSALTNTLSDTYIYYLWSEIAGYSRFGTYIGNGSSDGPFVFCGFRPAFLMIRVDNNQAWIIHDSRRNTFNQMTTPLFPNATTAENSQDDVDFLSNGFKLRSSDSRTNRSGDNHIFAAFAEIPFKYSPAK